MKDRAITVGVIGAGANTQKLHIPNLQAQKNVEVVAVANRSMASSQKVAKMFGIAQATDNWEDIVYDDEIDAVCIGTWPYMHAPLTIAALESGKHVLCEARMAMNSAEAQAMFETARLHPTLVAQIVPAPQTLEFDRTIIDLISEGYIGNLITLEVRITTASNFPQWNSPVQWRHDRDLSGNNIMFMGIWYETVMRWVGTARTVQAIGQNVVAHRKQARRRVAMTIPDHVDVLCEMEQGGQMRMCVSNVIGLVPEVDVYICGTEGTIRLSGNDGPLQLEAGRRGRKKLTPLKVAKKNRGGWRVEEEFINAIRGRETISHTDFATGLKYMEWIDAVTRAVRTRTTVHLPLEINY